MKIYTKNELIDALREIRDMGWIKNQRPGNDGGVGNTLEDLLGIDENNLPIPNSAEWELKAQRGESTSLTTLLHNEPSPTAMRFVSNILLPKYGWRHQKAGSVYPESELSFRQTINGLSRTDRGFGIVVNEDHRRIEVTFDYRYVDPRHSEWLESVRRRAGLGELTPQPYWGFDDLFHTLGTKLINCFYVKAQSKIIRGEEYFLYSDIMILQQFSIDRFLKAVQGGFVCVDFDARSGHNHGTKMRLRQNYIPHLYNTATRI